MASFNPARQTAAALAVGSLTLRSPQSHHRTYAPPCAAPHRRKRANFLPEKNDFSPGFFNGEPILPDSEEGWSQQAQTNEEDGSGRSQEEETSSKEEDDDSADDFVVPLPEQNDFWSADFDGAPEVPDTDGEGKGSGPSTE